MILPFSIKNNENNIPVRKRSKYLTNAHMFGLGDVVVKLSTLLKDRKIQMYTHDMYTKFLLKFENHFSFNSHHHRFSLPISVKSLERNVSISLRPDIREEEGKELKAVCVSVIVDMQRRREFGINANACMLT